MHGGDIYRNKVNMDFSVNLNPLGPPPQVLRAVHDSLDSAGCYPDLKQEAVRRAIAQYEQTDPSCIAAGCGASQLILAVVRALAPKSAVIFEPSYSGYEYALRAAGCAVRRILLSEKEGYALTRKDLTVLNERPDLVFVGDPINPSGKNVDADVLSELLKRTKELGIRVILDESFLLMSRKAAEGAAGRTEATGETGTENAWGVTGTEEMVNVTEASAGRYRLTRDYENLYIIRSLTKLFALPGIRMGYVMSAPDNISGIMNQLPEWNLPVTSEAAMTAGMEVLEETDYLDRTLEAIAKGRNYLTHMLQEAGLHVFDSDAPYLLFRGPETLCEALLSRGILIRDCSDFPGLTKGMYRIAVREDAECRSFVRILREVVYETGDSKA